MSSVQCLGHQIQELDLVAHRQARFGVGQLFGGRVAPSRAAARTATPPLAGVAGERETVRRRPWPLGMCPPGMWAVTVRLMARNNKCLAERSNTPGVTGPCIKRTQSDPCLCHRTEKPSRSSTTRVAYANALDRPLRAAGYRCELFASAESFLAVVATPGQPVPAVRCSSGRDDGPAARAASDGHRTQAAGGDHVGGPAIPQVEAAGAGDRRGVPAQALHPTELLDAIVDIAGPPIVEGDRLRSRQPWANSSRGGMGPWADPSRRGARRRHATTACRRSPPPSIPAALPAAPGRALIRREMPATPGTGSW